MKDILAKCEFHDFQYLDKVLDSYVSLTNDAKRKKLLADSEHHVAARGDLIALMDEQIRYYGSSDLAYLMRSAARGDGGVPAVEVIKDVCTKLGVKIKLGGSIESMLERLVNAVVEKELQSKTAKELAEAFDKIGVGSADSAAILEGLKRNGKAAVLPLLVKFLGPKVTLEIAQGIVVSLLTKILGSNAAKKIVAELVKRNPWVNAIGPIVWVASTAWLAIDLQSPAFRKTVPAVLYLGMVAIRDGYEDSQELDVATA